MLLVIYVWESLYLPLRQTACIGNVVWHLAEVSHMNAPQAYAANRFIQTDFNCVALSVQSPT